MMPWLRTAAYLTVMPILRTGAFFRIMSRADVFSLALFRTALAIAGAALMTPGAADAAACQGQIGAGTSITGKTAYDPFSPANAAGTYQIAITNSGAAACAYALIFRNKAAYTRLGSTLAYSLADGGSPSLMTSAPAAMAPAARSKGVIAPGGSGQIEYQLIIPRGQFAEPGTYQDNADLELYALDETGRLGASPLQTTALQISYTVQRVLSVNIKGADASMTTLRFGTLSKGEERTVEIQARSNLSYQLDVASGNRGSLMLTPTVPGQDWAVPYTAALGGRVLSLSGGTSLQNLPPTRPEADASFPLTVTIGKVAQKRAGRYEDVLTIEIKGATP